MEYVRSLMAFFDAQFCFSRCFVVLALTPQFFCPIILTQLLIKILFCFPPDITEVFRSSSRGPSAMTVGWSPRTASCHRAMVAFSTTARWPARHTWSKWRAWRTAWSRSWARNSTRTSAEVTSNRWNSGRRAPCCSTASSTSRRAITIASTRRPSGSRRSVDTSTANFCQSARASPDGCRACSASTSAPRTSANGNTGSLASQPSVSAFRFCH